MQWDFTPEEVVKGQVGYGLNEFRRDLFAEIAANLASDDENFIEQSFDLIYDLCYWEATGREFADFVATLDENLPLETHVLQAIKEHMRDNISMLGAILQRLIMDGVEQGMPLEQAVTHVAQYHRQVAQG